MNDIRRWITLCEAVNETGPLYHFTNVKGLIAILRSGQLQPGPKGRVSLTFDPHQNLFRYSAAVLVFDPALHQAANLTRHKGDAAPLAGGDEYEFFATQVIPLQPYLRAIYLRTYVFDDSAADFKTMYHVTKQVLRATLKDWQQRGVKVVVTDFNDTDLTWAG